VIEMSESINQRIIDAINKSDFDERTKGLLKTLLVIELGNFEEARPRYGDEYDRAIDQYLRKSIGDI